MILGIIGMLIIVGSWAYQAYRKTNKMSIPFATFYFLGSVVLTIYALSISDLPFIILNGAASILSFNQMMKAWSFSGYGKKGKHRTY
jgi:lipid-A-disaccharide synthase-like uncharacterized protein